MISSVRTLPPGSITIFAVEVDAFGNETYVGGPVTYGGVAAEDSAGDPIPASYATPPIPQTTVPVDSAPPGGRSIDITVREGITIKDAQSKSVQIIPATIEGTSWQTPENAQASDDNYATIDAPAGSYCNTLELSGFDVSEIPVDAVITGIRVTVERSKI